MRSKYLLFLVLFVGVMTSNAQEALSAYKYVIVPTKFDGFRKQNQYQTSTLIKYLLVERGLNAVYEDDLPLDLYQDKCLGVKALLVNESGTFTTKAHIEFQDCQLQEVYRTKTGSSKIKDFKGAFQEVIREAMGSLNNYNYTYSPKEEKETVTLSFKDDVKSLDEANDQVKVKKESSAEETSKMEAPEKEILPHKETIEIQQESVPTENIEEDLTWYAQEIPNGFQLVDKSPKVRLKLYRTQQEGVYLAEGESLNGVVYSEGGTWYLDYYQEGKLVHKPLKLKF